MDFETPRVEKQTNGKFVNARGAHLLPPLTNKIWLKISNSIQTIEFAI